MIDVRDSAAAVVDGSVDGSVGTDGVARGDIAVGSQGAGGADDPLFQKEEALPEGSKRALLLWQFFLFPILIVVGALGVFMLFSLVGSEEQSPEGLLNVVLNGGENKQKQAAQQLGILISDERARVESAKPGEDIEPAFYAAPAFRADLMRAFELALKEESKERQRAMARALGVAQVPQAIPALLDVLYSQETTRPQEVRRAAAAGLLHFEARAAEHAYLKMAADETDTEVAVMGLNGLALLGLPQHGGRSRDDKAVIPALRKALESVHPGVQINAAYGLAIREMPEAAKFLAPSLTREGLKRLKIHPELQRAALFNAIRGAAALGSPELRTLVEGLTSDKDARVADYARMALERWRTVKGD